MKSLIVGAVILAGLTGCEYTVQKRDAKLEAMAQHLLDATDPCIKSVRDWGVPYEESPACRQLDGLSMAYLQAGGGNEPDAKHDLIFASARGYAWMAVALSNGQFRRRPPTFSIW